ncbi:glycosyltransferase family 4 protein, partial [uncultured Muriicola sp.]|uniref:glycosyltransferase family 4 protein n=1 Tax=uncultured Muriicola sp. TaxID=1583102 RepID=UPI002637DFE2
EMLSILKADPELDVYVLAPKADGPLIVKLQELGIRIEILEIPKLIMQTSRLNPVKTTLLLLAAIPGSIRYLTRLRAHFVREQAQLIHSTGIKCHLILGIISRFMQLNIVWHLRDILVPGITKKLFIMLHNPTIHCIANSKATAESIGLNATVLYNGINTNTYKRTNDRIFNDKFAEIDKPFIIGIIGVLAEWKGQKDFLEMAKILAPKYPYVCFVIIGDAIYDTIGDRDYKLELEEISKSTAIMGRIYFAGFQNNSVAAINSCDLIVHASREPEPFGRVIVEAMSCAKPVIASAAGGVLEIISDTKDGLLFPPGDVQEMSRKVEFLVTHHPIREQLRLNGRKRVVDHFSRKKQQNHLREIYKSLLNTKSKN